MSYLPVAQREMRVAARQPRTHYARLLAALVAIVVVGYVWSQGSRLGMSGGGGRRLFMTLTQLAAWVCLLGGARLTADAISRERREGTLGFLFLSHLKGLDVVAGKLLAHATMAFYALLATMPVLGLSFLGGGVQAGEFWFVMLALANTLFFSVTLGLLVSSVSREPRTAVTTASLLALFCWLGLPLLGQIANAKLSGPASAAAVFFLNNLSPSTTMSVPAAPAAPWPKPWFALLGSHLLGWAFLMAAAAFTRRAWRERPAGRRSSELGQWWRNLVLGSPAKRAARRTAALDRNAFLWLLIRRRWKPLWPTLLVALVAGLSILAWSGTSLSGSRWDVVSTLLLPLGILLHVVLKFWVAGEVAAGITGLRRDGALEGLLTTPLTVGDIVRAQWLAVRRTFGVALAGLVALTLGGSLLYAASGVDASSASMAIAVAVASVLALAADLGTLIWLGTWRGISARKPHHAAGSAAFRVLVVPWIVLLFILPGMRIHGGPETLLVIWGFVGFVSDALWWQWSRQQLNERFRAEAARSFEASGKDWLERLAGR